MIKTVLPVLVSVVLAGVWATPGQYRQYFASDAPVDDSAAADRNAEEISNLRLLVPVMQLVDEDKDDEDHIPSSARISADSRSLSEEEKERIALEKVIGQLTGQPRSEPAPPVLVHNHAGSEPCPVCQLFELLAEVQQQPKPNNSYQQRYRSQLGSQYYDHRGKQYRSQRGSKDYSPRGKTGRPRGTRPQQIERKGPQNSLVCRRSNDPQDIGLQNSSAPNARGPAP